MKSRLALSTEFTRSLLPIYAGARTLGGPGAWVTCRFALQEPVNNRAVDDEAGRAEGLAARTGETGLNALSSPPTRRFCMAGAKLACSMEAGSGSLASVLRYQTGLPKLKPEVPEPCRFLTCGVRYGRLCMVRKPWK